MRICVRFCKALKSLPVGEKGALYKADYYDYCYYYDDDDDDDDDDYNIVIVIIMMMYYSSFTLPQNRATKTEAFLKGKQMGDATVLKGEGERSCPRRECGTDIIGNGSTLETQDSRLKKIFYSGLISPQTE